jgi:putative drug exporter of the RND superfamily
LCYARESGLTAADQKFIADDVAAIKELREHGVRGDEVRGPVLAPAAGDTVGGAAADG